MNVLYEALAIMQERGMCKHMREDSQGHVCLYGAVSLATSGNANGMFDRDAAKVMDAVAGELFPHRFTYGRSAAVVNNDPDTTQEDAELILKHAAYNYDLLYGEQ